MALKVGDKVEIDGRQCTVITIGATHMRVSAEDGEKKVVRLDQIPEAAEWFAVNGEVWYGRSGLLRCVVVQIDQEEWLWAARSRKGELNGAGIEETLEVAQRRAAGDDRIDAG